jgi:HSP20 family protein
MNKKKGKKVKIKKRNEDRYKPNYWAAFRQPNNLDNMLLDDPWSFPWIRQPGWRRIWSELWFGNNVKQVPIDLKESKSNYEIYAEIPGVLKENIEVQITPKHMALCGEIKTSDEENKDEYIWKERSYKTLVRSITFSNEVNPDKAEALLKNGVLKIIIPKKKAAIEEAGRRIVVKDQ